MYQGIGRRGGVSHQLRPMAEACQYGRRSTPASRFPRLASHLGKSRRDERGAAARGGEEPGSHRHAHGRKTLRAPGAQLHRRCHPSRRAEIRVRAGTDGTPLRGDRRWPRCGRPKGSPSRFRSPANVAAEHARRLLELWLANELMAIAVLLRPLLDRSPEHKALLVECLRKRARRPVELRHTVPKPVKRKLCKLAVAYVVRAAPARAGCGAAD